MKIKILFFSSIKDKLKKNSDEIEVQDEISVDQLLNILKEKYPDISDRLDNVMIAVNEEYKDKDYKLKEGDVVALIPPVSGG
jgi:molybdopterin synthase sulfur carrier subunit